MFVDIKLIVYCSLFTVGLNIFEEVTHVYYNGHIMQVKGTQFKRPRTTFFEEKEKPCVGLEPTTLCLSALPSHLLGWLRR